jgi:hypothetical protein
MFAALTRVQVRPRLATSWSPSTILAHYFSSTPVTAKYKLKSHSGAKKRWKALASGVFKRVSVPLSVMLRVLNGPRHCRHVLGTII